MPGERGMCVVRRALWRLRHAVFLGNERGLLRMRRWSLHRVRVAFARLLVLETTQAGSSSLSALRRARARTGQGSMKQE